MTAISAGADLSDIGPPDVQCDRCKAWVPQDEVKVLSGFTWCADCQQGFLDWLNRYIEGEE